MTDIAQLILISAYCAHLIAPTTEYVRPLKSVTFSQWNDLLLHCNIQTNLMSFSIMRCIYKKLKNEILHGRERLFRSCSSLRDVGRYRYNEGLTSSTPLCPKLAYHEHTNSDRLQQQIENKCDQLNLSAAYRKMAFWSKWRRKSP